MMYNNSEKDSHITTVDIELALKCLKSNKSDGVCPFLSEHFLKAPKAMYTHIAQLFSAWLSHGYIPQFILLSTLIPLIKDRIGDKSDLNNYRAIALCALLMKLFDLVILNIHSQSLKSSDWQFAYKAHSSTTQCTWVAREIVSYYNNNGSPVYACLLDCSKAFDKIRYDTLFNKLLSRGLSPIIVRALFHVYQNSTSQVRWNNALSDSFDVSNGVRQGAILSPILFNIYMDELIMQLRAEGYGCWQGSQYFGALVYADDIMLLAPSLTSLQKMLDVCSNFGNTTGLSFNPKKSICIHFHASVNCLKEQPEFNVHLGSNTLKWNQKVKHLGHTVTCCLNFDLDVQFRKGKFISCVNNILTEFGFAHPDCKIQLIKTYGSSFYGAPLWNLYGYGTKKLYTTWNIAMRKLLDLPYQTHTRFLDVISGLQHVKLSLKLRFLRFINSLLKSTNPLINQLCHYSLMDNMSPTGYNLGNLLHEFNITVPASFVEVLSKLSTEIQTYKMCSNDDMVLCSVLKELIDCKYGTSYCGLNASDIIYMITDIAVN